MQHVKWQWRGLALFASMVALVPRSTSAHVKWFEDPARHPLRPDLILSARTAITVGASAAAVALLYLLRRFVEDPHWPEVAFLKQMAIGAPTLLAVQASIGLVHAAVQPALLVPSLPLGRDALGQTLAALQLLIAFSLLTGLADWLAALALIALGLLAFLLFPPLDALEQVHWVGIGIAMLVIGSFAVVAAQSRPWFRVRTTAWSARAVAALRILTGLAIIAPALTEKIWNPDLGAAFLADHPDFNFMRGALGLTWFTDDLFVLAAGVTEAVIGVLLISGLLTRVVILFMWVPFAVSVPFLYPQELLGHMPILGTMYFLLVHSAGIAPGESLERAAPPGCPSLREVVADGTPAKAYVTVRTR